MLQAFWDAREKIVKITGAFLVLGLLIALFSPEEYTAEATLMPESQEQGLGGKAGSLLSQYGGMLGISPSDLSGGQTGSIPPQLYPKIAESLPYQLELMHTPVYFASYDTTAGVHEFYTEIYSPSIFGYIKEYTIGLPGKMADIFSEKKRDMRTLPKKISRDSVLSITEAQMETVKILRDQLLVSVDQETGVLNFSVTLPDANAAAEVSQLGISLLKEQVKAYRTQKTRQNLAFVQQQVDSAKKRFNVIQQKLAEFRDSNLNLATAKAQSREQELQSQYDLAFNLYNSLSQQLEQAKLELQKDTPVLSVLQPVSVPLEDNTSGLLILIVSGMLGFLVALGYLLAHKWWKNFYLD
ncbi:Chain length determinant protein [Fodinibius salinus]|uniref:Chain length determinant protein n=1 Tax=Fodinibius salinus TaxID=860790 RepID=A0A5D3YST4_9BACT|nr:Chain length determinant protein [Fodinibius salinus]